MSFSQLHILGGLGLRERHPWLWICRSKDKAAGDRASRRVPGPPPESSSTSPAASTIRFIHSDIRQSRDICRGLRQISHEPFVGWEDFKAVGLGRAAATRTVTTRSPRIRQIRIPLGSPRAACFRDRIVTPCMERTYTGPSWRSEAVARTSVRPRKSVPGHARGAAEESGER